MTKAVLIPANTPIRYQLDGRWLKGYVAVKPRTRTGRYIIKLNNRRDTLNISALDTNLMTIAAWEAEQKLAKSKKAVSRAVAKADPTSVSVVKRGGRKALAVKSAQPAAGVMPKKFVNFTIKSYSYGLPIKTVRIHVRTDASPGERLRQAFIKAVEQHVDLEDADFKGANLSGLGHITINADDACFDDALLQGTQFHRSSLRCASFRNARGGAVKFFHCDLRYACFNEAEFIGQALFEYCNVDDAKFNGARMSLYAARSNFLDADVSGMIFQDLATFDKIIGHAVREHGSYDFLLVRIKDDAGAHGFSYKIRAGCGWRSIEEYREHMQEEYNINDPRTDQTVAILKYFETLIAADMVALQKKANEQAGGAEENEEEEADGNIALAAPAADAPTGTTLPPPSRTFVAMTLGDSSEEG